MTHERRHSPRFTLEGSVRLSAPGCPVQEVRLTDISLLGAGMSVSRSAIEMLAQGGKVLLEGDRVQLDLSNGLPSVANDIPAVSCRVRHARRLSLDRYHVGVLFVDPDDGQRAGIAGLVEMARAAAGH
ncbi:MAG: PilZ domain-containing protein [Gammaproteobacteria bacterium]|nr:PilZ domain-containing protein [Gammaproteobacteria bacterium]